MEAAQVTGKTFVETYKGYAIYYTAAYYGQPPNYWVNASNFLSLAGARAYIDKIVSGAVPAPEPDRVVETYRGKQIWYSPQRKAYIALGVITGTLEGAREVIDASYAPTPVIEPIAPPERREEIIGRMTNDQLVALAKSAPDLTEFQRVAYLKGLLQIRANWRYRYWTTTLPRASLLKWTAMGVPLGDVPYGTTDMVHVEYDTAPSIFGAISEWSAGRYIDDIMAQIRSETNFRVEILGYTHHRGHMFFYLKSPVLPAIGVAIAALVMKLAVIFSIVIVAVSVFEWMTAREVTAQQAEITERDGARLNALELYRTQVLNDPSLTNEQKESLLSQAEKSYQQAQEADKAAAEAGIPWTKIFVGAGAIIILVIIASYMMKRKKE